MIVQSQRRFVEKRIVLLDDATSTSVLTAGAENVLACKEKAHKFEMFEVTNCSRLRTKSSSRSLPFDEKAQNRFRDYMIHREKKHACFEAAGDET